jgi:hypothetical protein
MVIPRVVYENDPHDTIQVIWVLVIDRNASLVFERLANPTLENISIEIRKE